MNYADFLTSKIKLAEKHGITVGRELLHPSLREDQKDVALWALELGAALIAIDAGGGKTRIGIEVMRILQQRFGGNCLIVTELGAADTFVDQDPEVGEGVCLGLSLHYVINDRAAFESESEIVVTNYERVRMGAFNFSNYTAVWLDEGNYIKNMASETTDALQRQLAGVKYKYIATATPSPNENLELVNYAHALGICDRGQILTRFFQRNSTKAGELTLHPQHEDDFWLWVHSWCIAITSPNDLGYNFPGFKLPELNIHWVEVPMHRALEAGKERDGQGRMFIESRSGLSEAAKIKRESIEVRIEKAMEIVKEHPDEHFILWHHLEDERKALNSQFKGLEGYGDLFGSQNWEVREKRIVDFTKGDLKYLATKPELSGVGCNFQKHCSKSIFIGINDSFNDIYQAIKRTWRFYNPSDVVDVWLLYTPEEYGIVNNIKRKWDEHNTMRAKMREIIKRYGLNHSKYIEEKRRSFITNRKVYKGDNYTLVNNDCVYEFQNKPDNSVDLFVYSFPFGNHYEYTDKYNDFGHNQTDRDFKRQLMFLLPEMLRTLKPGRIAAIHLKNRIHYGSVTGLGFSIFHRFTHMVCDAMEEAGFQTMGFHYIPTDVVAENNQTYRLGFREMQKDSTKMGAGIPEEIWVFRKCPTSNQNAYADEPVKHNHARCKFCGYEANWKEFYDPQRTNYRCDGCGSYILPGELITINTDYTLANWQLDADAFWKSSGNRLLTPLEIKAFGIDRLQKWWKKFNSEVVYDYEEHVKLLQELDKAKKLSRTFTTLPIRSNSPYVWNDVNRMHGLNLEQARRKQQNHICPMPFDEVDRLIELYSNPSEEVADPFGGLCTTGVRAIAKGRKAFLTELNEIYTKNGAFYLKEAEMKKKVPTLFDMLIEEKQAS